MTRTHSIRALSALAAVAAMALSGAAFAQDAGQSITVRYDDLNLSSPEGHARIMQRIEEAADRACTDAAGDAQLSRQAVYRACKAQAVQSGVQQLNALGPSQLASASGAVQIARR